jgi:hypothetical protein
MRRNPRFYVAHCGGEPPMVPAPSQTVIPSVGAGHGGCRSTVSIVIIPFSTYIASYEVRV